MRLLSPALGAVVIAFLQLAGLSLFLQGFFPSGCDARADGLMLTACSAALHSASADKEDFWIQFNIIYCQTLHRGTLTPQLPWGISHCATESDLLSHSADAGPSYPMIHPHAPHYPRDMTPISRSQLHLRHTIVWY